MQFTVYGAKRSREDSQSLSGGDQSRQASGSRQSSQGKPDDDANKDDNINAGDQPTSQSDRRSDSERHEAGKKPASASSSIRAVGRKRKRGDDPRTPELGRIRRVSKSAVPPPSKRAKPDDDAHNEGNGPEGQSNIHEDANEPPPVWLLTDVERNPAIRDNQRRELHQQEFQPVRALFLRAGAQGNAHGYVRLDNNGRPTDHQVIKDTFYNYYTCGDATYWQGDFRSPDRKPMEIAALERLWSPVGDNHCLSLRASEMYPSRNCFRTVTNYAHYGDLWDFLHLYKDTCRSAIPEAAIWSIIHDLSRACCAMAYGTSEASSCRPGWETSTIVHRDITLDNVYLTRWLAGDVFPSYPSAVLGDFGHSVITSPADPCNPAALLQRGTIGWLPLELAAFVHQKDLTPFYPAKLSEKTNVWGVGAIAISLMDLEGSLGPGYESGICDYRVQETTRSRYSTALVSLAESCYRWNPAARPTTAQLYESILWNTEGGGHVDYATGTRTHLLPAGDPRRAYVRGDVLHAHFSPRAP